MQCAFVVAAGVRPGKNNNNQCTSIENRTTETLPAATSAPEALHGLLRCTGTTVTIPFTLTTGHRPWNRRTACAGCAAVATAAARAAITAISGLLVGPGMLSTPLLFLFNRRIHWKLVLSIQSVIPSNLSQDLPWCRNNRSLPLGNFSEVWFILFQHIQPSLSHLWPPNSGFAPCLCTATRVSRSNKQWDPHLSYLRN